VRARPFFILGASSRRSWRIAGSARHAPHGRGRLSGRGGQQLGRCGRAGRDPEGDHRAAPTDDRRHRRAARRQERLDALGFEPIANTSDECANFFQREMAQWSAGEDYEVA
jgi:hypothetical protein